MRTRGYAGLAAAVLSVALSGCGDSEPSSAPPASPSASPSGSPFATSSAAPAPSSLAPLPELPGASDLASAAEAQASQVPSGAPIEPRSGEVLGADLSWPQCPAGMGIPEKLSTGAPLPTEEAEYVVIGLTNGPGFYANPCLADQVAFARERGLLTAAYSVISRPEAGAVEEYGGLREVGYAQAQFNVASMRAAGLASPLIWLDVEQVPSFEWGTDTAANAEVVLGAAQGYADAGYRVGVYSTPYIWESLVGDLALGVPEWRAAGQTSKAEALDRCGLDWSIQGGPAVMGQWVQDARDKNVTCPGISADLGEWFGRSRELSHR